MKKVIRLTESELIRIVKRVIKENNAPERYVIDVETGKMVGTHQYGVGFTVNKIGERMGYESDPVSIPDGTKMEDNDNSPMRRRSIGRDEMPPMRRYNDLNESDFEDEVYDDKNELIGHYSRDPERLDTARFIPNRKGEEQGLSMGARTPERSYKKPMGRSKIKTAPLKMGRAEMPPMRRYDNLGEQHYITNNSDFAYPEDPYKINKFDIEDMFEVASSVSEANNMIKDYYPGFYFDKTYETDYGKTMAFFSPEGKEIASKYIVGCCGGAGNLENLERFRRSNNDAIYNPRKRY